MSHEDGVIATNDDASNCKRYRVFIFVLIENYDHCLRFSDVLRGSKNPSFTITLRRLPIERFLRMYF